MRVGWLVRGAVMGTISARVGGLGPGARARRRGPGARRVGAQHAESLGDGPELAHVARERLLGDGGLVARREHRLVSQEVTQEERDVLAPLPERRDGDVEDREAEVEVLAERALSDEALEIAVGRGDEAHVHRPVRGLADATRGAGLEQAQELGLDRER